MKGFEQTIIKPTYLTEIKINTYHRITSTNSIVLYIFTISGSEETLCNIILFKIRTL